MKPMGNLAQQVYFDQLSAEQQLQHLDSVARRSLPYWGISSESDLKLLSLSENATYLVKAPNQTKPLILRVHRTGYHSRDAIRSELAWMKALQDENVLETPQAIAGLNGDMIQMVYTPEMDETRFVALFHLIPGVAPDESELIESFKRLGIVTAKMHNHAQHWQRPDFFERLVWDFDGCLGKTQLWGDWRLGPSLDADGKAVLEQTQDLIESRLQKFGMSPERFGLIHADLRIANLLESDGNTRVIDFDDAGLGWFLYDIASAVSFIETREDLPELIESWLAGYKTERELSDEEIAEIPTFIMLRRMTLLAWIASHSETELAQSQGEAFTRGTVALAHDYLQKMAAITHE